MNNQMNNDKLKTDLWTVSVNVIDELLKDTDFDNIIKNAFIYHTNNHNDAQLLSFFLKDALMLRMLNHKLNACDYHNSDMLPLSEILPNDNLNSYYDLSSFFNLTPTSCRYVLHIKNFEDRFILTFTSWYRKNTNEGTHIQYHIINNELSSNKDKVINMFDKEIDNICLFTDLNIPKSIFIKYIISLLENIN